MDRVEGLPRALHRDPQRLVVTDREHLADARPDRRGQQVGADLVAQDEHPEARPLEPQSVGDSHGRLDVDLRPDQDGVLVGTSSQPAIQLIECGHHVAAVPDR